MEEDLNLIYETTNEQMQDSVLHFEKELVKIRAGKASPEMLDGIMVDYYGSKTQISQVANVNTQDSKTIVVQAWEQAIMPEIEKAIINSNIGLTPMNDGKLIRISVPPLTEERRKNLLKQVKQESENAKISIRNVRKDANDEIKNLKNNGLSEDLEKTAEAEIQKQTKEYSSKIDKITEIKESDLMTI